MCIRDRTNRLKFAYIWGSRRNGLHCTKASAPTVDTHTSLCVHSHPTIKERKGKRHLVKTATALFTCSRGISSQWSAKRLSTHQLSYATAGVYDTFRAWCPRCDSPVGSNLESLRATQSSQWTRSHSVSSAWRSHTEKGGLSWLKQHNFVIFRCISTTLGDKVYIWLFDSHVKFYAKICTHGWNINKSRRGLLFYVHPVHARTNRIKQWE